MDQSRFVYDLATTPVKHLAIDSNVDSVEEIPKRVIQFWDDLKNVPSDVGECFYTWDHVEEHGYERLLFGHSQAQDFIAKEYSSEHVTAYNRCHHPAMQCDYFRLCYLLHSGGAYIDADEYFVGNGSFGDCFRGSALKLQPLCFDRRISRMVGKEVFLAQPFSSEQTYYFNNDPIFAVKGDPIISIALQRATEKLLASSDPKEIQYTTGPINMTESVLLYLQSLGPEQEASECFQALTNWDDIAFSKWDLKYRDDGRDWRKSNPINK